MTWPLACSPLASAPFLLLIYSATETPAIVLFSEHPKPFPASGPCHTLSSSLASCMPLSLLPSGPSPASLDQPHCLPRLYPFTQQRL